MYYESAGHGPPLLFAHGAGGNALSWWQQTAFFGARYRCITFDHPGFRHSKWDVADGSPNAIYGDVLKELLDHLELEQVGLVAQSMGGWTCLRFAIDNPDRVASLVMAASDGGLYLPDRASYSAQERNLVEIRAAWQARLPGSFHPAAGERMLQEQPDLHEMYVQIGEQNDSVSYRGWGQIKPSELDQLECSVMLISGDEDPVCPPERIAALSETLGDSKLVAVPRAGHSVYFERADLFNRMVDEFLGETYPSGSDKQTIMQSFANPAHD